MDIEIFTNLLIYYFAKASDDINIETEGRFAIIPMDIVKYLYEIYNEELSLDEKDRTLNILFSRFLNINDFVFSLDSTIKKFDKICYVNMVDREIKLYFKKDELRFLNDIKDSINDQFLDLVARINSKKQLSKSDDIQRVLTIN